MFKSFVSVLTVTAVCGVGVAADWSGFRGPNGNGISDAKSVPIEWSVDTNILWKVALPGQSNGSPILSNGRVFLTSAEDDGKARHLHCYDAKDGSSLWAKTVAFDKVMPTHKTNLYGGTTPASDGERVVVWHGSAGLYCYDIDGKELWNRHFGDFRHQWGYGTSPVLRDGKVILHSGPGAKVFVAALDLADGKTIWQTDEPQAGNGETNTAGKYMGSWSTPVILQSGDKALAVCSMATRVNAYDLESGDIVWSCDGLRGPKGDLCYTSPVIAGDVCVAMGGFNGPAIGFRMEGSGDITATQRLWRVDQKTPQRIGSGVFLDGLIYMANAGPNILQCIDPETGDVVWQERAPGGAHWSSLVAADGHLFVTDQSGTTHILKASREGLNIVASNKLGESSNSTPAIADGRVFLRTFRNLYCVGK
ncbi:MAG: PQQ-like beta-propeller repeat protein [Planctomycetota bacterium]|nr:PQQ-like beta-propeller repeat protein [Planctomycetota bacterium]MDA1162896.1 PQQ-like beta-propeller repeat protein [Planctomycetota bacterium]